MLPYILLAIGNVLIGILIYDGTNPVKRKRSALLKYSLNPDVLFLTILDI